MTALLHVDPIDGNEHVDLVELGDEILDVCIFNSGEAKLVVQLSMNDDEGAFLGRTDVLVKEVQCNGTCLVLFILLFDLFENANVHFGIVNRVEYRVLHLKEVSTVGIIFGTVVEVIDGFLEALEHDGTK